MKGQISIEFMLLLVMIVIIIAVVSIVLYQKIENLNGSLLNETGQYQLISSSFYINQSGIMYGKIQLSKYVNFSSINISFVSNKETFDIPFNAIGVNTSYGYTSYLTENSTKTFSAYLYNQYKITYMRYSNKNKNYFITANYSGYFN